jgi:uncharacterized protein (TIGR02996 family)
MPAPRIAKPFRRRLPAVLTAADWQRIAQAPSYRAPRPQDVLNPPPFEPPGPPPMSAEQRWLLDAVLADPDADEPRLRYAEWCDRQGDSRGAFIRQQIEEFRRQSTQSNADQQKNDFLTPPCSSAAIGGEELFSPWSAADFVVRRGFVEGMSLSGRAFITLGEPLFRMTPLRDVRLVAVAWYMDELARTPHLANVERLDLSGNRIGPAGVRELAASRFVERLKGLNLSQNSLGNEGLRELLRAPWRGQLRGLGLAANGLDLEAVEELLSDPAFTGLIELDLAENELAELPTQWPRLQWLRLAGNPLSSAAVETVAQLDQLRSLDLRYCRIGPDGAAALARSISPLEDLELGFNDIADAGAAALAFPGVRRLSLRGNRIGPDGAAAMAGSGCVGTVVELDLMTNRLGDAGVFAIMADEGFASLERLNVANNDISDAGVQRLAASGSLGGLVSLSLAWNIFGDAGVNALASCPDLAGLRELDLTGTRIGFAGAKALVESPYLMNLRRLVIGENHRLPEDAGQMLRERFGTTK